jgi:hypothetical protein
LLHRNGQSIASFSFRLQPAHVGMAAAVAVVVPVLQSAALSFAMRWWLVPDQLQVILIVLIVLHVGTVLYYKRIKNDDLIIPMLTGDKVLTAEAQPSRDTRTSRLFALAVLFGCAYVVYRLVNIA